MFIVYPTNIDYLIDEVRLHIGDTESTLFSDSVVRSALISAVKTAYRRWSGRYLVYDDTMAATGGEPPDGYVYAKLPSGYNYIPSGLVANDVFRNPAVEFTDVSSAPIAQEDEMIVVLIASIILRRSYMSSSVGSFVNWSDGKYSYSNVSSAQSMRGLIADDLAALEGYFKLRLAKPLRQSFPEILI